MSAPEESHFLTRTRCPICRSEESSLKIVHRVSFAHSTLQNYFRSFYADFPEAVALLQKVDGDLEIVECTQCHSHHQRRLPKDDWLNQFYSRTIPSLDEPTGIDPYFVEQRAREWSMVLRYLDAQFGRQPRTLDYGCGPGQWLRFIGAYAADAHGCDVALDARSSVEKWGARFFPADGIAEQAPFDFIHTEQVLEHVSDPHGVISALANKLSPGGVLQIGVPFDPELKSKVEAPDWNASKNTPASMNALAPLEHLQHFSPQSFPILAERLGLEVLSTEGWALISPTEKRTAIEVARRRVAALLRRRQEEYHPYWRRAQTWFLQKPAL